MSLHQVGVYICIENRCLTTTCCRQRFVWAPENHVYTSQPQVTKKNNKRQVKSACTVCAACADIEVVSSDVLGVILQIVHEFLQGLRWASSLVSCLGSPLGRGLGQLRTHSEYCSSSSTITMSLELLAPLLPRFGGRQRDWITILPS